MIIGVTGTNGAGKGTVVDYLVQKGYTPYSASGFIAEEVERRGMPLNRDSLRLVANDLRKTHNPAYVFESLYERVLKHEGDAVMEAPRAIAEARFLKDKHIPLIAVDADRVIRYERILKRKSAKDSVSFEEFCAQEEREMNATESHDMNIAGVMAMSDFRIMNNGSLEELHAQVDQALAKLEK